MILNSQIVDQRPLRILFVEDEPADVELAQSALAREGLTFESMSVDTPNAFETALTEFHPDIVISDYAMPVFDGMRALQLALAHDPHLPFIVFTASRNEETAVACIKAGATDYVLKDRRARLPFAVREALKQNHIRREKQTAEKALREQRDLLATIFDSSPSILMLVNEQACVSKINHAGTNFANRPLGEAVDLLAGEVLRCVNALQGEGCGKTLECGDCPVRARINLTLATGQSFFNETARLRIEKNDQVTPLDFLISTSKVDTGEGAQVLVMVTDVSSLKRAEQQLLESEARFATIFHASPLSIALSRLSDQRLIDVNAAWENLTGWTRVEGIGRTRRDLNLWVSPDEEDRFIAYSQAHHQVRDVENQIRRKSGEVVDLLTSVARVELAGESCALAIALDVTERQRAAEALRTSELWYRALFENAAVPIWEEDFSKIKNYLASLNVADARAFFDAHPEELAQCARLVEIISVNHESARVFRVNHEDEIMQHQITDYFVDASWQVFQNEIVALLEGKTRFEGELPFLDSTGKIRYSLLRLSVVPGFEHTLERVLLSFVDITERKEMEETLSTLSRRLFEAQEAERRNVARELHDEIGQVLTAVKSNLQTSRMLTDPQMSANFLEESIGIVDQALRQVRDLSLNLRPALLDDFGLVPALEWYLHRQASRSNFAIEFTATPRTMKLPQTLAINCFRVAQAALTNIERHAQAKHVQVDLRLQHQRVDAQGKKAELVLTIVDDGVGFDPKAVLEGAKRGNTLGIAGMQERVRLAGGQIEIHSRPRQGAQISARFPIVKPKAERRARGRVA